MPYLLDKDGVFEVRTSMQGEDSGNGVFCVGDVIEGTSLPYYATSFRESRTPDDMAWTYVIAGDFNNSKENPRTSKTYSMDGHPLVAPVKSLPEHKKLGCQINEASKPSKLNCIFAINLFLTKFLFKESSDT